jgi:disulfide oxidoreductase YuzD
MINYGEELAYWYLRLNGFFPLTDFVIHMDHEIERTSDCDVLAVRPAHVYEEIGGQPDDWDDIFPANPNAPCTIGVICQVKTGQDVVQAELFPHEHVIYAIKRLGLCADATVVGGNFTGRDCIDVQPAAQLMKLLIAQKKYNNHNFKCLTVCSVREFIRKRLIKYKERKYGDRLFFPSVLLQNFVDEIYHDQ